ncbi:PIR Superfamily Protein [Plasmodium ovale wallikeri]|uniref:PIR Superfamily Protein n=1 Tax=Plasmodium ovale wallikeri TaxID=864142 RepID=A0A1A8YLN6_PLAOA|nr:PIR Superfamily Protein [Plasmodium ovale wallikeri]SBT55309.1 PIR Superfamily Protein [Plasmodium ovale wallikeri]
MEKLLSQYQDLPAYQFFRKFDSTDNVNENCERCIIRRDMNLKYPWIKNLCCKLEKNMSIIYEKENVESNLNMKHCFDLNYWLYNEVYKNLSSDEKQTKFYHIVDYLLDIWSKIKSEKYQNKDNLCNPDKTLSDMNFLKEVKSVFDNIENYDTLKKAALENSSNACDKYYNYMSFNAPLYYKWRDTCTGRTSNVCSKYIKNYNSYSPGSVMKHLNFFVLLIKAASNPCFQNMKNLITNAKKSISPPELKYRVPSQLIENLDEELESLDDEGKPDEEDNEVVEEESEIAEEEHEDITDQIGNSILGTEYVSIETEVPEDLLVEEKFPEVALVHSKVPENGILAMFFQIRGYMLSCNKRRKKKRSIFIYPEELLLKGSRDSLDNISNNDKYVIKYHPSLEDISDDEDD